MMRVSIVTLLVIASMAYSAPLEKPYYNIEDAPELFEKFIKDFNKVYKDDADRQEHYNEFVKSLEVINKANAESDSAVFDINEFADYTPKQRKNLTGRLIKG